MESAQVPVKVITFAYDLTDSACSYIKQRMSDKITRINEVDCQDLADKVNGYWIETKDLTLASGKACIDLVTSLPGLVITGYDLIGTIPIAGRVLQVVVFCLATYVAIDLIRGPEKHVFIPKDLYDEYMLDSEKTLRYYLEKDALLEFDLIAASKERLKPGDTLKELTLKDGKSILEIPASAYRKVLEAHKIPIRKECL
jgi:hypothetical protein